MQKISRGWSGTSRLGSLVGWRQVELKSGIDLFLGNRPFSPRSLAIPHILPHIIMGLPLLQEIKQRESQRDGSDEQQHQGVPLFAYCICGGGGWKPPLIFGMT